MKFKKYIKESNESVEKHTLVITEDFVNPDAVSYASDELARIYNPIEKMIEEGNYEAAKKELEELSAELDMLEEKNAKRRFFKYPQSMIDAQRKNIENYCSKLPKIESLDDMDKRCEVCNTLLNDAGSCPKCDEGEEDYGDEIKEDLSIRDKLLKAYPELNFDTPIDESCKTEELSNKEKLKRAYPELNFDTDPVVESANCETSIEEELTNSQKLKAAYPELNFDTVTPVEESMDEYDYDDEYDIDDVEQDRRHAALYGGERSYCDCGKKLSYDEYGSYCPECNPREPDVDYSDEQTYPAPSSEYDDEM